MGVQKYYDDLKANNAQRFNKQVSKWEKALKGQKFEAVYKKVHAAIRAAPARKAKKATKPVRNAVVHTGFNKDMDPPRQTHPRPAWRARPGQDDEDPEGTPRVISTTCVFVQGMDSLLNP